MKELKVKRLMMRKEKLQVLNYGLFLVNLRMKIVKNSLKNIKKTIKQKKELQLNQRKDQEKKKNQKPQLLKLILINNAKTESLCSSLTLHCYT
jgi:hypothetical protein